MSVLSAASSAADGGTAATDLDLDDSALMTSFDGVLNSVADGPVGTVQVRISRAGRFSARFQSLEFRASGRGTIDAVTGMGTGEVRIGWSTSLALDFQVGDSASAPGTFYLEGSISSVLGEVTHTFIASPAMYSSRDTPPESGQYSMGLLGATSAVGTPPPGDGVGSAQVGRGGRVMYRGYHSDGNRFTCRAIILQGNCTVFYATIGRSGVAVGEIVYQDIADMSDFDGEIHYRKDYTPRDLYAGPYSFTSNAVGNLWIPGMDPRAAMGLSNNVNNAVLRLTDGPLDGQDAISTVDIRGRISIPRTQTLRLTGRVNGRDGMVMGNYQYSDPTTTTPYAYLTRARFYAATLPKMGETRGFYVAPNGGGAFEVAANDGGALPPITAVNPRVQSVGEYGVGYRVQITASEPWEVEIPEDVDWLTVSEVTGDGDTVISILVSRNASTQRRTAYLIIAGQLHVVAQYGSSTLSDSQISINPEEKTIGILGGSYVVQINSSNPGAIPPTGFQSLVDWVQVIPIIDPTTGLISGANVTVNPPTGDISVSDPTAILRSAQILIAGVIHTVNQIFAEVVDPAEP